MGVSGQGVALIAAAVYVCLLAVIYAGRGSWPLYRLLSGRKACIISLTTVLSLLLIFGLVPQDGGGDGLWGVLGFRAMKRSPVFIAALLLLATSVALNAIEDIHHFSRHRLGVTCSHITLSIILLTGIFAGGTTERAKLEVQSGHPVHTAADERDGVLRKLPFELTLRHFDIEDYASEVTVTLPDGSFYETSVAVNHPAKVGSWMIYQTDYRMAPEGGDPISVFKCVYSPLSGVYNAVLYMILISAAAMAFVAGARPGARRRYLVSTLVSAVFVSVSIFRPGVHTDELLPALRSPWLVPHITAYIFAYTLMGIVTILAVCILWSTRGRRTSAPKSPESVPEPSSAAAALRRRPIPEEPQQLLPLCDRLVRIGWAFLTMGMVMGALWAKQAWGDWWAWDPKEVWAAVTWMGYLLYLHLRNPGLDGGAGRPKRSALVLLLVCFALLQMCWWGVNLLPAARGFSLHTY